MQRIAPWAQAHHWLVVVASADTTYVWLSLACACISARLSLAAPTPTPTTPTRHGRRAVMFVVALGNVRCGELLEHGLHALQAGSGSWELPLLQTNHSWSPASCCAVLC